MRRRLCLESSLFAKLYLAAFAQHSFHSVITLAAATLGKKNTLKWHAKSKDILEIPTTPSHCFDIFLTP